MSGTPLVSLVVPVYRNAATLSELVERVDRALLGVDHEMVFVIDGSPDDSLEALLRLRSRRAAGAPALRVLASNRNHGQHTALVAGFDAARGAVVLTLDADLQDAPEELPRFFAAWQAGDELVSGVRRQRRDAYWSRLLPSRAFNAWVRFCTGQTLRDYGCALNAIDRRIARGCGEEPLRRFFLKPLLAARARSTSEIEIAARERTGPSSYTALRLVRLAAAFWIGWSARPWIVLLACGSLAALAIGRALWRGGTSVGPASLLGLAFALGALFLGGAALAARRRWARTPAPLRDYAEVAP